MFFFFKDEERISGDIIRQGVCGRDIKDTIGAMHVSVTHGSFKGI
jgi:hypothetical protein